jgi:hypothetical protein
MMATPDTTAGINSVEDLLNRVEEGTSPTTALVEDHASPVGSRRRYDVRIRHVADAHDVSAASVITPGVHEPPVARQRSTR